MGFPVDDSIIAIAETVLGRVLPNPLRTRLQQNNGGEVDAADDTWCLHPVWDPSDRRTAGRTANHLVRETELAREWSEFPPGAVAIASNGTGDLLILRSGSDVVEMWDHETGELISVVVSW